MKGTLQILVEPITYMGTYICKNAYVSYYFNRKGQENMLFVHVSTSHWPQTVDLPDSTFPSSRINGIHHHIQPFIYFFFQK